LIARGEQFLFDVLNYVEWAIALVEQSQGFIDGFHVLPPFAAAIIRREARLKKFLLRADFDNFAIRTLIFLRKGVAKPYAGVSWF
jgi:hypothetical protein